MSRKPTDERVLAEAVAAVESCGGDVKAAAVRAGVPYGTFYGQYRKGLAGGVGPKRDFEVDPLPSEVRPLAEIISARKAEFSRKQAHEEAAKLLRVKVNIPGPIGIVHFGDPHLDDPGSDLAELERHVELVRHTDGMFGANIGDYSNNWTGRLAALHANQSVTAQEAWQLVRWFVKSVRWLYLVAGNHDQWSGAGDPVQWFAAQANSVYRNDGIRLGMQFPNGREVRINARHAFSGHSQWNNAHGPMKAAQMGWRDHILIAGHTHVCGYGVIKDPSTGTISHCLRVGTYKKYDPYASQRGFPDGNFGPAVCTIIDPDATDERGLIQVDWDIQRAADWLTWLRKKRKATARQ